MINQAPIVRYTASVCETFLPNFWRKPFSAESIIKSDPVPFSLLGISMQKDPGQ
jgi:hypothetical protein